MGHVPKSFLKERTSSPDLFPFQPLGNQGVLDSERFDALYARDNGWSSSCSIGILFTYPFRP